MRKGFKMSPYSVRFEDIINRNYTQHLSNLDKGIKKYGLEVLDIECIDINEDNPMIMDVGRVYEAYARLNDSIYYCEQIGLDGLIIPGLVDISYHNSCSIHLRVIPERARYIFKNLVDYDAQKVYIEYSIRSLSVFLKSDPFERIKTTLNYMNTLHSMAMEIK